jgi:hypothetical protein
MTWEMLTSFYQTENIWERQSPDYLCRGVLKSMHSLGLAGLVDTMRLLGPQLRRDRGCRQDHKVRRLRIRGIGSHLHGGGAERFLGANIPLAEQRLPHRETASESFYTGTLRG